MGDYLSRLVERASSRVPVVEPILPPLYATGPTVRGSALAEDPLPPGFPALDGPFTWAGDAQPSGGEVPVVRPMTGGESPAGRGPVGDPMNRQAAPGAPRAATGTGEVHDSVQPAVRRDRSPAGATAGDEDRAPTLLDYQWNNQLGLAQPGQGSVTDPSSAARSPAVSPQALPSPAVSPQAVRPPTVRPLGLRVQAGNAGLAEQTGSLASEAGFAQPAGSASAGGPEAALPPVINVTIGRVEVRAAPLPAAPPAASKPRGREPASLEDYLRERSKGSSR